MWRLTTGTIFSIVPYRLDNNASFMAQPMITVLNFDMSIDGASTGDPTSTGTTFRHIDLAKELSKVNRKLYRQCRRYAVAGIQVIGNEGSSVSFFTAHDTWVTKNAIKKAFHMWQKMNKQVLAENPSIKPTWHDFKVFLNYEHRANYTNDLQATPDFDYAPFSVGEWQYSKLVFPESHESNLMIHGNHVNAGGVSAAFSSSTDTMGIIEAYKESRATVQDESPEHTPVVLTNPYNMLFDHGDVNEDILDNLEDYNDNAPYPQYVYNGDSNNRTLYNAAEIRVQSSETVNMTNGFVAPCGLIKVATSQDSGIMRLKVFLVPANNAYGIATEAII